jgi:hypothetical protein
MFPQMGMGSDGVPANEAPDLNVYFTDDSGLLLTDPEGNLITEG